MAIETLMFKLEGVRQAGEVSALVGKTFTVGKVTGAGNGLGNGLFKWLFLVPSGEAAGNTVALKIEGGRQAVQLAGLAGKTVTVGQAPTVVGGTGHWLVLNSGGATAAGAVGAAGVVAKGEAGGKLVLMQLEGTQQAAQLQTLAGKTFTVIPSPMVGGNAKGWLFMKPVGGAGVAGKDLVALQVQQGTQANLSGLMGKSFTLGKAPLATGNAAGNWIVLKPAGGVVAKGAATGAAVAAKGGGVAALPPLDGWEELGMGKVAGTAKAAALPGGGVAAAAKPAATKAVAAAGPVGGTVAAAGPVGGAVAAAGPVGGKAVATAAKGGTIWNGTGLSLGLGLGLGSWGPVLLAGLLVAVGYGTYRYYRHRQELDDDMVEAG
ncbi:MAG: hypothetical protein H7838_11525 [Magnetococcus sp. DMHC-8]